MQEVPSGGPPALPKRAPAAGGRTAAPRSDGLEAGLEPRTATGRRKARARSASSNECERISSRALRSPISLVRAPWPTVVQHIGFLSPPSQFQRLRIQRRGTKIRNANAWSPPAVVGAITRQETTFGPGRRQHQSLTPSHCGRALLVADDFLIPSTVHPRGRPRSLVDDLLDRSKIESGRMEMDVGTVSVSLMCQKATEAGNHARSAPT